ncbi:MAG: hypothetical protein KF749_04070 [Bacteroidetes bacterium]|nr:hypothetical protein [Bacteroidota bacterium]MCW5897173.1 hypothetical protein [Bacteroidota bacterium]
MRYLQRVLLILFTAVISLNCFNEPLSPVSPTWDATATFPLSSRTYTLGDLISKDTSLLKRGEGSQISVSKSASVPPTFVNDFLTLNPKDTSVQMQLGAFSVSSPDQAISLEIPWLPRGYTIPIPDTVLHIADIHSRLDAFETITLKSGTISLRVDNNLPVPMEILSPIQLLDLSGAIIAVFHFSPAVIPAHSYRIASDDLGSKSFSSDYRMTGLEFHTPGSAVPVMIPIGELLTATISTSNLKARQATLAHIPQQRLADNDSARLRMDDSTLVKEVHIKSGRLNFAIRNDVAVPMVFVFQFNQLYRRVGSAYVQYEDSLFLPAGGNGSMSLDLANTRIKASDNSLISSLDVAGSISIAPTQGQPVSISETDLIHISVTNTSTVVVDSAVGVVKPTWVDIDTKVALNFGTAAQKFSGQLILPSAQFRLATSSSVGFPADAYFRVGARRVSGDSVFLAVPASQRRITPGGDEIVFNGAEVGQFLSQLSAKFPDSLRVYGRFLVNPHDVYVPNVAGVASVGSKSALAGSASVDVPLNIGIVGGTVRDTLVIGDTSGNGRRGVTFDQSFLDRYNKGNVYIELENGTPADLTFKTSLLNLSLQNLLTLPHQGHLVHLSAAQVNSAGDVVAPSRSTTVLELTANDLSQFNPAEFVAYTVGLNTAGGSSTVQFKTNHQVKVRVWTTVSGRVGK